VFRVEADGKRLWNKHDDGGFPKESDIVAKLRAPR
jgi:predicted Rdx family selenoprotein